MCDIAIVEFKPERIVAIRDGDGDRTVRAPILLTLALAGTVPLTGDPSAGDVMFTIRLPSNCAWAGCGAIKPQPSIAERAAA